MWVSIAATLLPLDILICNKTRRYEDESISGRVRRIKMSYKTQPRVCDSQFEPNISMFVTEQLHGEQDRDIDNDSRGVQSHILQGVIDSCIFPE